MTTYRLYPSTNGPATSTNDGDKYVMGISFKVTSPGVSLTGWWHWCAPDQQTAAEDFALWVVNGAASGTYVTASKVTSGTFTTNAWNFVAAASPIPLTSGQEYRAVKSTNKVGTQDHSYSHTSNFWDTGAGAAGITNGPLVAFSGASPGTLPEPADGAQMVFTDTTPTTPDVTTNYPSSQFNQTNYWLDVQVDSGSTPPPAAPAVMYSMRSFP